MRLWSRPCSATRSAAIATRARWQPISLAFKRGSWAARTILHRDDKWLPGGEFSSDGTKIVSFETDHRMVVRDAVTRRVIAQVRYDGRPARLVFIDDDRAILVCDDHVLRHWDLQTGT